MVDGVGRCVAGRWVERGSIVRIVGPGRRTIEVASCTAGVGVVMPALVAELVALRSVAAAHIVQLDNSEEHFGYEGLRMRGVYSLGLRL